ncbi:MAG: MBL fold metallo-hydrolase [Atribacterota bacterium]|nr:MBL fold metallo-hydrolase [Atribacterota bacterium]MDY0382294.1 MBL fold metallo-hydrolase [Atribacterota bacterium]
MKIKWLGHSCFLITNKRGINILTDPFDDTLGYKMTKEKINIITISHEHYDHNNTMGIKGKPVVLKGTVNRDTHKMIFKGISSYHDSVYGKNRGNNTIFIIKTDEMVLCHLGDLGHVLENRQLEEINQVDILFIPVGGYYTLNHIQADQVIEQLKPKIVLPMHYKTDAIKWPIDPLSFFLDKKDNIKIMGENSFEIEAGALPEKTAVYVLDY